ncbi:asparagine synthase (glutamine-hydrolyzing) [Patiriisocius sp. Uisw_017]|uniref:asparagine synthase (glutamine-hydrolyzing) n=1 Tax=Patiriisocius sp. Uisw_017 TaxID=3230968 RepID=UPI0039EAC11F
MCGIFGTVNKSTSVNSSQLIEVSKVLKHRGPDDEGFILFTDKGFNAYKGIDSPSTLALQKLDLNPHNYTAAFLHRRLSILDLSDAGHQPMSYLDNRFWITLNGEIYNYLEIKEELIGKGYKFRSNTDTEVVLASYAEWGADCVNRFNGMWAFAIWDSKTDTIFLSRDRLGIKPLNYYHSSDSFIFSSEIKGILSYLGDKPRLNQNKIREYFVKGQILVGDSEETMFEGIRQLLPGCNMVLKNQKLKITKYWEIEINISKLSREEHIAQFKKLFSDSLKLRLRSDVEVGSCLSGGIDSSSIVAFASKEFNKKFNTFSAIWPGTRHDEYKYMKLVNEMYHTKSNYIESDISDIISLIDKITWHQEIPMAGSSLIAQWEIMRKSRQEKVPVLLDGQGADEILSGYPVYLIPYLNEIITKGKMSSLVDFIKSSKHTGFSVKRIIKQQIKKYFKANPETTFLPISRKEKLKYSNSLKYNNPNQASFLPDYLKEHIEKSNLPSLLHFEDRNSMAHSVEARVPFLDYRLVEFSLNIPSEQKIGNGFTKTIMRDAMKDYVPHDIFMRRDKIGFSTPIEEQMVDKKSQLYQYMNSYLVNSDLWKSEWIDKENYKDKHLFALYSLQRFIEIYG